MTAREERFNRLRIAICAVLLVLTAAQYLVVLVEAPEFVKRVAGRQVPVFTIGGAADISNEILAAKAERRGLSLEAYAWYYLVVGIGTALGFWVAAGLVLWKHGGDWFRWLTALALFFFPSGSLYAVINVTQPVLARYLDVLSLIWPVFTIFLYLFPNGRGVPRWSRWPMALLVAGHLAGQVVGFLLGLPESGLAQVLPVETLANFELVIAVEFLFIIVCQVYRYARGAGPLERRQMQWFVAALVANLVLSTALDLLPVSRSSTGDAGYASDLSDGFLLLLIPAAITIAILRYRLWDIDVIIRRTLIYSVLTGLLAVLYLGSVLVLGSVVRFVTGQAQSTLVVVMSTLAIAALFVPVRRRVQGWIDRRFYRRKYDAARTLAGFAAGARDETDLERLSGHLVQVVEETMQPEQVSLWLRPTTPRPGGRL